MDKPVFFKISDEGDAWKLLDLWMSESSFPAIEFDRWPLLKIEIKGENYKSSLNSGQMDSLVGFQMAIGRAYAAIAHGAYDKRRLKKDEDAALEFSTSVTRGSSILETDLSPLISALSNAVTAHPEASLIAGVIIGLAVIGRPMVLKHFEIKSKQIDANEREKLVDLVDKISSEDRKKIATFESAINKLSQIFPAINQIVPDLAQTYWQFAASSTNADRLKIADDVILTKAHLAVLSERRTTRPIDKTLVKDTFIILGIVKIGAVYRIQMKGPYFVTVIYANKHKSGKTIQDLMIAMAQANLVEAEIELKTIDGSQVIGKMIDFDVIPLPKSGEADEEL